MALSGAQCCLPPPWPFLPRSRLLRWRSPAGLRRFAVGAAFRRRPAGKETRLPVGQGGAELIVRECISKLARQFEGAPYIWAGNGPVSFDCSGFVMFVLRPFGLVPTPADWYAERLREMFAQTHSPEPGDLVFYGQDKRASHVMVFVGEGICVGACGGTSKTRTLEAAIRRHASVKLRRVEYRKDLLGFANILAPLWKKGEISQ